MLKFVEKLKLDNKKSIVLIRELKIEGEDHWAYMEMTKDQVGSMNRDWDKKVPIALEKYGTIIEDGYGRKPNSQVRKRMQREYGWEE